MLGFIYMIYSKNPNIKDKYIGCTKDFEKRVQSHKHCCSNSDTIQYKYKLYEFMRANGGFDSFNIIKLEQFVYINNSEKHIKESQYFNQFEPTLNANVPNRNQKESYKNYYLKNREYLKAKMMERYFKRKAEKIKII